MQLGVCTTVANAALIARAGFDFIEENARRFLEPDQEEDARWSNASAANLSATTLPIRSANVLLPGELKVTGPAADPERLRRYIAVAARRAARVGIRTLVFGAGASRNVPDGFDRHEARRQIVAFLRDIAPALAGAGLTLAVEHLNRRECNILNTLDEAADVVREVDHPAVGLLLDTYHFWLENSPYDAIDRSVSLLRHIHVADREGRTAPGLVDGSGRFEGYVEVFRLLRKGGYDGTMSVESAPFDPAGEADTVAGFLRRAWASAAP